MKKEGSRHTSRVMRAPFFMFSSKSKKVMRMLLSFDLCRFFVGLNTEIACDIIQNERYHGKHRCDCHQHYRDSLRYFQKISIKKATALPQVRGCSFDMQLLTQANRFRGNAFMPSSYTHLRFLSNPIYPSICFSMRKLCRSSFAL